MAQSVIERGHRAGAGRVADVTVRVPDSDRNFLSLLFTFNW